ncbi:TIGR01777 family oxidoreductase [Tomitella biformata]|uniref:TIGR01777 family oxidoreductase n=1 Tax=Tomitella biformata TaxID=630403 RepID=UPI0004673CDD|nr:TIGR01777 family oxidoreductase [Tomitella biformata]
MGITYASEVEAAQTEVFDWHSRPGAFTRLSPPWQPMRLLREADSLADGSALLRLPGGVRWVAQHDAAAYDPPRRFVDYSAGRPLATVLPWRHTHTFAAVAEGRTLMTDQVETVAPEWFLRPMFEYRHRQVAADLAAHRWADSIGDRKLTVAITGSSGLVGTALSAFLSTGGHRVIRLVRRAPAGPDERRWDVETPAPDLLAGVDAVIHLAGASIGGRFTPAHKRAIRASRIEPTRKLAQLAADTADGPATFLCASAVGFYGRDRGDEVLTEDSTRGDGFLADTVADWEAATAPASAAGLRVVAVRTGIVQSPLGGVLRLQRPMFELGVGGRLGSGQQWLSWIDLDDLVGVYHRALVDLDVRGPVNAVAPHPVRNAEYAAVLAKVLRRPAVLPAPAFGPRLLLGAEGARELALACQRVAAGRLEERGHRFRHPDLETALRHQLGKT